MTTVSDIIDGAVVNGRVVVYKTFMGQESQHTFTSAYDAEQFIKNDIYNNIQMHMAPNVEMPVNVCGVLQFKVTPTVNSYEGDTKGGSLDYANDTIDSKR